MKPIALALCAALTLTGCAAVGPDYETPRVPLQAHFVGGGSQPLRAAATDRWWLRLHDPLLNALVARGLAQNLDIETALERIREASAAVGRTGINSQLQGAAALQARRSREEPGPVEENSGATVDASYVFDLFGGVRRGNQQALANFEASRFDAGTVRLAYLSDIVGSYLSARYFQEAAELTRWAIDSRQRTLNVVSRRRDEEEATTLEVAQAESLLSTARASLPSLEANFKINVFRIATLLNEPAGPILARMQAGAAQPYPRDNTGAGVPADLLRNRPDVRFAERSLAASVAGIGVAEAALYPSLTLSGSVTEASDDAWSFGPVLSLPLLNRGVLNANRRVAVSQARQSELIWRNTVRQAVEEVQVAIALRRDLTRQVGFLRQAADSAQDVLRLSRISYQGGEITLNEVLDAEQRALANRLSLAVGRRDVASGWVQLQVATGRGWYAAPSS